MKRPSLSLRLLALLTLTAVTPVQAQVTAAPAKMTFQGRLTKPDGTPVSDGTYAVRFSLHDALTGGNEKWSQTLGSVTVRNGTFAALLDVNTTNLFAGDLYLEIKIGTDTSLTPRQPLVSVPYALKANSVPDGSIGASQIANGSITGNKLAGDALNNLSWLLGGNAATASHFLGTTNNQSLVFKTNNIERMRLDSAGALFVNGGIRFPASFGPNPDYVGTEGNYLAFAHGGVSEDFLGYKNNTFYFKDSPGGGDTSDPNVIIGGNLGVGTDTPLQTLDVNGRINVANGVIQRGGPAITNTSDLGLYSQVPGNHIRFVTTNAPFRFYSDGGAGTNAIMNLESNGDLTARTLGLSGNLLDLGHGVSGREGSAGKIGYGAFTADTLDIVGAGTAGNNRKIKFWNEGGATFTGGISAPGLQLTTGAAAGRVLVSDASGNGTWQAFNSGGWLLNGNSGTNPGSNFLGTTDGQPLAFRTNNAEQMRLLTNGNLGIGTGAPATKLHITNGDLRVDNGQYQSWGPIVLRPDVDNSGDGIVQFLNSAGGETMRIHSNGNVGIGHSDPNLPLTFANTDGYKINFGGDLRPFGGYFNARVASDTLIFSTNSFNGAIGFSAFDVAPGMIIFPRNGGSNVQVGIGTNSPGTMLDVAGNIRCVSLTQTSDGRYKQNIATLPDALDTILNLRGVTFDWNRDAWNERNFPEGKQLGFIAQEVEKVLPELVSTDDNGYKSVSYANVVPVLVEALKAQQKQIEALKAENTKMEAMQAQLDALTRRMQQLTTGQK